MCRSKSILMTGLSLLISLLLVASATTQVATHTRIADGCPGSQGVPSLQTSAESLPILGDVFSVELSNVPDAGVAIGITGLSTTIWRATALPFDLTLSGLPGCFLHTDVRWTTGLVIAGGRASWDVNLPGSVDWIGRSFFQQVFVLEPGGGASMSDASEAVIGWTPPDMRLESTIPAQIFAWHPEIASSGDSVYVVWEDGRSGMGRDVRFNRSLDGGATWMTTNTQLNTEGHAVRPFSSPQIVSTGDSVYVVWTDQRDGQVGNIYLNASHDRGATWMSSDIRLDTDMGVTQASLTPLIEAIGDSVYVTWSDLRHDRTIWGLGSEVYFNRSLDGGLTWLSNDIRLTTHSPGFSRSGVSEISAFGDSVYVIWQDRRAPGADSSADIYFNRSLDRGATWLSSDVAVGEDETLGAFALYSDLLVTDGALYVTWGEFRTGTVDVFFNCSRDGGVTWQSSDMRMGTDQPGTTWSSCPQIAGSGTDLYVTWYRQVNDTTTWRADGWELLIAHSPNGGATWFAPETRLDTGLSFAEGTRKVRITTSGDSVFVTWSAGNQLYLNRSTDAGATWLGEKIRLDTDRAQSHFQEMAVSGDHVYVTWADRRGHFFKDWHDVYFNRVRIR